MSGVMHVSPTCRRCLQRLQKLKKHLQHCASWSSSSKHTDSQRGQYTTSVMESNVFCNSKFSHRSNASTPRSCFNKPGGIEAPHLISGQFSLLTVPSFTWTSAYVSIHLQQKICWHGNLTNSVPRYSLKHIGHSCRVLWNSSFLFSSLYCINRGTSTSGEENPEIARQSTLVGTSDGPSSTSS
eukprot:Gb_07461 [translate_table: standard]